MDKTGESTPGKVIAQARSGGGKELGIFRGINSCRAHEAGSRGKVTPDHALDAALRRKHMDSGQGAGVARAVIQMTLHRVP